MWGEKFEATRNQSPSDLITNRFLEDDKVRNNADETARRWLRGGYALARTDSNGQMSSKIQEDWRMSVQGITV